MRYRLFLLGFLCLALFAVGCTYPQTLRFSENNALIPTLRAKADFRYHFGYGWETPQLVGTPEAELKEGADENQVDKGAGLSLSLRGEFSGRQISDTDTVRTGEVAIVNGTTFNPGTVDADLILTREDFGFRFNLFSRNFYFQAGLGFFLTWVQIGGEISNDTVSTDLETAVLGPGVDIRFEVCPGFKPVRLYLQYSAWGAYEGTGYLQGNDTELGIMGRWRGIGLFAGYRFEYANGRAHHHAGESRLVLDMKGPVFGVDLTF